MKTIAINGTNGFIGKALCNYFADKYHVLKILRSDYHIDPVVLARKIEGADIVINIAGASIGKRWSASYRSLIFSSRIDTTRNLVRAINYLNKKPELFISASAIGIYDNFAEHSERSVFLGNDFMASVCINWEAEADAVKNCKVSETIVRFGLVLGRNGGILPGMILPFRFCLGCILGNGRQFMSVIHVDDLVSAFKFIIENHIEGVINMVAPEYITNAEFSKQIACFLKRPLFLKVPEVILKWILGDQRELLLGSKRVLPEVLLNYGFTFNFKNSFEALKNLIQKR